MSQELNRREFEERAADSGKRIEKPENPGSAPANLKGDPRTLFDDLPVGLYVVQEGRFVFVNSCLQDLLGYAGPEELLAKPLCELVHADDWELVRIGTEEKPGQESEDLTMVRVLKKDGTILWARMGFHNMVYQGAPGKAGYLIDLTPMKLREKSLEDSLEKYQTIINEIGDGVAEADLKGNLTFNNDTSFKIWGTTREEAVGGTHYLSYMDKESAKSLFQAYNKVFRTGISDKITYEINRKDGKRRIIEDSVSLIRKADDGSIIGFRSVSRDITDRREAEKRLAEHRSRLEAIFGSVKDGIITVDPELKVIEANKSMERICGASAKEITGSVFPECLNQCSRSCYEVLRQTLEKKATVREYRIECGHSQHHQQCVSVTSSPLHNPEREFMGAVLVIRDMTLMREMERELRERHRFQNLIGGSIRMQDIYRLLEDLANLETTVLVTGESGTGKDLIARALHYSGQRSYKPFVTVNCSALAENLLESELFGHVKGAFTGAIKDKTGRFQAADGGTILLDEIGDISPLIQLKLLRVLQEKEFERVGESTPQKVDVRVIACTNKDLKEKVERGEFRQDLYYRLKVVEIALPPLRDRLEDLPLLVDHFCRSFNGRFEKNIEGITNEVLKKFMDYPWPGNVRELEHVMEHAFVLCRGGVITMEHLPVEIIQGGRTGTALHRAHLNGNNGGQAILDALVKTHWNKTRAARLLGISRQAIYRKIYQYRVMDV